MASAPTAPFLAGPESHCAQQEAPLTFSDLLDYADEEIRNARRLRHDNTAAQRKLRLSAIEQAEDYLWQAKEALGVRA